ncbi:hypothetical protein J6590_047111 [Homalodisca vitripennis]|nr:hypothetical protein J6590_047111 [Homalodisca vitripennis]
MFGGSSGEIGNVRGWNGYQFDDWVGLCRKQHQQRLSTMFPNKCASWSCDLTDISQYHGELSVLDWIHYGLIILARREITAGVVREWLPYDSMWGVVQVFG